MIQKVIEFETFDKLNQELLKNNFNNYEQLLIQIFTGSNQIFINELILMIHSKLPNAKIIGASAYNGIINDNITMGKTIISFSCFEKTKVETMLVDAENTIMFDTGVEIAKTLIRKDTKLLIIFSHGNLSHENYNTKALLEGVNSINDKIIVVGGAASSFAKSFTSLTAPEFNETFVFNENSLNKTGIVAAALSGKELKISNGFNLGWKTIGKKMTVTKVEKIGGFSRIYTINNIPVVKLYEKYFGSELVGNLLSPTLTLSFVIEKNGVEMDASPLEIFDDLSVSYSADVEDGDSIWFGYGDIGIIIGEAIHKVQILSQKNPEAIFTYSCLSRPVILGSFVKNEIIPFSKLAPTCGFFTNGEFITSKSKYFSVGKTMSFIGLSENYRESPPVNIENDVKTIIQMNTSRGTYNMIQTMTAELEEDNKILHTLVEIGNKILEYNDLESFLSYILNKAFEVIKIATHGVFFSLNDKEQLELISLAGFHKDEENQLIGVKLKLKNSLFWLKTEGKLDKTIILKNISKYNNYCSLEDSSCNLNESQIFLNKMIAVPIKIDNKFYGTICIDTRSDKIFDDKHIELMNFFAEGIAIVIKNKLLFDKTLVLSKYDALTGVTNRGYFEIALKEYMKTLENTNKTFSIIIIDLNYLKKTNDTYGHDIGDALLKDFSDIVSENTRKSDVFARFGGDEFALALFDIDENLAKEKAGIIRAKINEFNTQNKDKLYEISYSEGIASYPSDGKTYDELIKVADERMYDNKKEFKSKKN